MRINRLLRPRQLSSKVKKRGSYEERYGKERADMMKAKISLQTKGIKNPFYGKKHTEKTKKLISKKRIVLFKSGYIHHNKNKPNPIVAIRNLINNPSKRPEVAKKISENLKKHPERQLNSLLKRDRMTNIERIFDGVLISLGYQSGEDYKWNMAVYLNGQYKFPDFVFPKLKVAFEVDGEYWHRDFNKDESRDRLFIGNGFKIIHIKESELKDLEIVKSKVVQSLSTEVIICENQ